MKALTTMSRVAIVRWGLLSITLGTALLGASPAQAALKAPSGPANYVLQVDGTDVAYVRSIEGGGMVADAVSESSGGGPVKKHPGNVRCEDLVVDVAFDLRPALLDWITTLAEGRTTAKTVGLVQYDPSLKAIERRVFTNAVLKGVAISPFDATDAKAQVSISLRIAAESSRTEKMNGEAATLAGGAKQKAMMSGYFRAELEGIDTTQVVRIGSINLGQTVRQTAIGVDRLAKSEAGPSTIDDFELLVLQPSAQAFVEWHTEFTVRGNNADDREKTLTIVLLGPSLKDELARITLSNVGILRCAPERHEATVDSAQRYQVRLYAERIRFARGKK